MSCLRLWPRHLNLNRLALYTGWSKKDIFKTKLVKTSISYFLTVIICIIMPVHTCESVVLLDWYLDDQSKNHTLFFVPIMYFIICCCCATMWTVRSSGTNSTNNASHCIYKYLKVTAVNRWPNRKSTGCNLRQSYACLQKTMMWASITGVSNWNTIQYNRLMLDWIRRREKENKKYIW